MSSTHESAAEIIARCWRDGVKVDGLPREVRPRTVEEFVGQRHLVDEGKVLSKVPGRLFAGRVLADGARVSMQGNRMLVAECEFVFTLADDLPPRDEPYLREEVMAAVASLHPGLELPDSRFEHFESAGAAQLAADNACAHWMVVGPATEEPWRESDLSAHETALIVNGKEVTRGRGADVLGDPRDALTWLANQHGLLGEGLRAGQLITTVTGQPCAIAAGDRVEASLGVFGTVAATLTD